MRFNINDTQVFILCGGRGTRLGNLTNNTQKCMLPVGGRPFLDLVIKEYAKHDLKNFTLLTGHYSKQIEAAYCGWGHWHSLNICFVESPVAGTATAIKNAYELDCITTDRIIIANGDTLIQTDTQLTNCSGKAVAFRIANQDCGVRLIRSDVLIEAILKAPETINGTIEDNLFPLLPLKWMNLDRDTSRFIDIGTPENYSAACRIFR